MDIAHNQISQGEGDYPEDCRCGCVSQAHAGHAHAIADLAVKFAREAARAGVDIDREVVPSIRSRMLLFDILPADFCGQAGVVSED